MDRDQLQQLQQMRGVSESTPFIYSAVQEPMPTDTGFDSANAIIRLLAPLVAKHVGGMQDPRFLPRTGPGISAYEAFYARDVNTPLYQAGRQQQTFQHAGMLGDAAGQMGVQMGAHKLFDMSPTEFRQQAINMGQTSVGRMATEHLMNTPTMRSIMGGDPNAVYDRAFRMRSLVGSDGMIDAPRDMIRQTELTQHASDFADAVTRATYGRPDGSMGITQNRQYTQNFLNEDMADIGEAMFSRNAHGIQGADPKAQADRLGDMARVLRSVADVTGGESAKELIQSLDQLTQGEWGRINPQDLERTFREIGATSRVLGVGSDQILRSAQTAQNNANMALGISEGDRMMGFSAGGYAATPAALERAQRVQAIGHSQGVLHDPQAMAQIEARQSALMHVGMQSERGSDIMHMAYLAQTGRISETQYAEFREAQQRGTIQQARTAADMALEAAYGSASRGREMFDDPAIRRAIISATDAPLAQMAMRDIDTAQQREFGERVARGLEESMDRTSRGIREAGGVRNFITGADAAELDMRTIEDYFGGMANEEEGQLLSETARNTYEAAVERARADNPDISDDDAARRGIAAVEGLISSDFRYQAHSADLNRERRTAKNAAEAGITEEMSEELMENRRREQGMSHLRSMRLTMDQATEDEFKDVDKLRRDAERARNRGEHAEADRLESQYHADYESLVNRLGSSEDPMHQTLHRSLVEHGERAERDHQEAVNRFNADRTAHTRLDRATTRGGDVGDVVRDQQALLGIMQGVASGDMSLTDAADLLDDIGSLSSGERDHYFAAMGAGGDELKEAIGGQQTILNALEDTVRSKGSDYDFLELTKGLKEAETVEDYRLALRGDGDKEPGLVLREAMADQAMSDLGMSMGLEQTFPQLITEGLTGNAGLARILGLEDASQVRSTTRIRDRRRLRRGVRASDEAREALTDSYGGLQDLTDNEQLMATGVAGKAMAAANELAGLAGTEDGITDEAFEDVVDGVLSGASNLSDEDRQQVQEALMHHREALDKGVEAGERMRRFEEKLPESQRRQMEIQRERNRRDAMVDEQGRAQMFQDMGVPEFGGLFAGDIDASELDKDQRKQVHEALKTLGVDEGAGVTEGVLRAASWVPVPGVRGLARDGADAMQARSIDRGLEHVAAMSEEDIANLSIDEQDAIKQLGDVRKEQRLNTLAQGEEKGRQGGRGDKDSITLSGTLVLKDQQGNRVGTVDDLRRE